MKQKWGREESAGEWPSSKAVWTIGALFVALAAAGTIYAYSYARVWTPLERNYLTAYLATDASALRKDGGYTLLMVETRKGPAHLAMDAEVTPAVTASGENTFALTDAAVKAGDTKLEWQRGRYDNARLHAILAHWIYSDQSLTDLAKPALWSGLGVFLGRHTARSSRADAEAAEEIYSSVHRHTGAPYAQREANSLRAVRYFRETSYPLPSPFRRTNIFPEAEVRISSTKRPFTIVER